MPAWGVRTALVALRAFLDTPAAGQLGGLDMGKQAREKLAGQSRAWRCTECGRSNEAILAEAEEASNALETGGAKEGAEGEKVPEELKLGYREDLGESSAPPQAGSSAAPNVSISAHDKDNEDDESAELAEGFVRTAPLSTGPEYEFPAPRGRTTSLERASTSATQRLAAQRWVQQQPQQPQQSLQQRGVTSDGVPAWVDRAIAVIFAAVVALILKLLLRL